ncbi:MAG: 4a-hydroxytetrahydrobiopterin dehydratase [Epsilonproteobacteria bacterium]|nr:4a-hydroxytetrahydrobiopterin dehydratase [Campylobacterota bacterium]
MIHLIVLSFLVFLTVPVWGENSQSCDISEQHCVPCEGGVLALSHDQVRQKLGQVKQWHKNQYRPNRIMRAFFFNTFAASIEFVNTVAQLAENEGHHPDIFVFNNQVQLHLYTHAADGLTENDFIMAAKINQLTLPADQDKEHKHKPDKKAVHSQSEVKHLLARMPDWNVVTDIWQRLSRELEFKDFVQAIDFMNWLAQESIQRKDYPEMYIFYNRMKISLSTKSARGFTLDDFDMACMIDQKFDELV